MLELRPQSMQPCSPAVLSLNVCECTRGVDYSSLPEGQLEELDCQLERGRISPRVVDTKPMFPVSLP